MLQNRCWWPGDGSLAACRPQPFPPGHRPNPGCSVAEAEVSRGPPCSWCEAPGWLLFCSARPCFLKLTLSPGSSHVSFTALQAQGDTGSLFTYLGAICVSRSKTDFRKGASPPRPPFLLMARDLSSDRQAPPCPGALARTSHLPAPAPPVQGVLPRP